jgi:transposase
MPIIGCDFHPRYQQVAVLEVSTGELMERRVEHEGSAVREFYAALPSPSRVGIEATGYTQWFERLLQELGHELWVGDPAQIRAGVVRQQKTDPRDALHLAQLLASDRFPRIWLPTPAERELRQLVLHRAKVVQWRTRVKNQLQALAMSQGVCRRRGLWSQRGRHQLEALSLGPWSGRRRKELLEWLDRLDLQITDLDRAVENEARARQEARRLMTHPGVGPVTALAFVLTMGPVERFQRGKQVVSYLGLNPREHSSGGRQRMGRVSKQGNSLMRWLLVEAGQTAARLDPELQRMYRRLKFRRCGSVAKVAVARRLAVRMYWMLRAGVAYPQVVRVQSSSGTGLVNASSSDS